MRKEFEEIPNSEAFPIEDVLEKFGYYFTSQIGWMIGLAILEGFKEIHIYGADLAMEDEYMHQRPNCEYLIGWARGAGITVYIPRGSDLLKAGKLYGFEDNSPLEEKTKHDIQHWNVKIHNAKEEIMVSRDERNKLVGALDGRIDSEEKRIEAERRIKESLNKERVLEGKMNQYTGMVSALSYIKRCYLHY